MLKNNKILKAQMGIGIPVTLEGVPTAGGLEAVVDDVLNAAGRAGNAVRSVAGTVTRAPISMGTLAATPVGLAAYAMTRPHAASGAVQRAHRNQLAKEKEEAIRKEQQYWNNKADFYSNALSNGAIMTPTGVVITGYNPSTRTISGYKDVRNGDRIFLDQNLQTGVYSNPVYKDTNTGAYYEGTLDLNGTIPIVGRGENLMPYSIIPVEKPEWMVSNPNDILESTIPIIFKKITKGQTPPAASSTSQTSESAPVSPKSSNEEDEENKSGSENDNSNKDYNKKGYKKSSVEEWMNEFPEKVNSYRRWRIGNSKDVFHNKNGNINWNGTKLLNRGVTPTNTGQSPSLWGTRLKWGIGGTAGGGILVGMYSALNNKPSQKPELDGVVTAVDNAEKAISEPNNSSNYNQSNNSSNTSNNANYNMIADPNQYNYD